MGLSVGLWVGLGAGSGAGAGKVFGVGFVVGPSLRNISSYVRTEEFKFLSMYSTYILKLYGFHSYTVCIVLCVRTSRINKDSCLTI